jgi:PAS domain S-box-containing protein
MVVQSTDVDTPVFRLRKKDGSFVWVESVSRSIRDEKTGLVTEIQVSTRNITERKRAEEALRESEERYSLINDSSRDSIYSYDTSGRFTSANRNLCEVLQLDVHQIIGHTHVELGFPDALCQEWDNLHRRVYETNKTITAETYTPAGDGKIHYYEVTLNPLHDDNGNIIGIGGATRDITERKQAEEQLRLALADKETLLQELYHRTKNNMQAIIGLINLQAAQNQDEQVRAVLQDTQNRVRSMALVHQKLYQSQNLSSIDLAEYIRELISLLMASYQVASDHISLGLDLEPVPILIDTAVPCGLIINELVSNVFKHAFPHNEPGALKITLKQLAADEILLQIADDGVGLPAGFTPRESMGVGLQTVFGIAEYQLRGKITYETAKGVTWRLQFSNTLYYPRV